MLALAKGCERVLAVGGTGLFGAFLVAVAEGGGGRGMLGGGGIVRPVGLFTFFILAFALGGGMGVLLGVTSACMGAPPPTFSFGLEGARVAVGFGGGGRR